MKVLATYNFKGGVGKTSTCVALAYLAAEQGLRTLLWDLDPQGAATWIYRVRGDVVKAPRLVSGKVELAAAVRASDHENLDVVPADDSYRDLEPALVEAGTDRRLRELLEPLAGDYDLVLLDAAPTLARVAENVFGAADALLAPTVPTPLSLRTLARLLLHLKQRSSFPRVLPFLNMVDRHRALHRQVAEYAEAQHLGFLATEIPYSSAVERMSVMRRPLHAFASRDRAARAYRALWAEVCARLAGSAERDLPSREGVTALLQEVRASEGA